ncbi:MAG TPA: flagellar filament capping protein FliD, partial [Caldimonas sp.]
DGSMTVNDSTLSNALGNLGELKKMFTNVNSADPTQNGFATQFRAATDSMLGIDGAVTTRTDGLNEQLQRNQSDQDTWNTRLAAIETRLRAQYTALDATMAQLTTQSSYLTQQIAQYNASSSSK